MLFLTRCSESAALPVTGLTNVWSEREAMWINFVSTAQFVIKILLGGINAISGEPAIEDMATKWRRLNLKAEKKPIQDYIITPEQLWLDGISVPKVVSGSLLRCHLGLASLLKLRSQARTLLEDYNSRSHLAFRHRQKATGLQVI